MKFYTRFNPPPKEGIVFTESSLTHQEDVAQCEIGNILKRYDATGELVSPGSHELQELQFGDATLHPDYETALELVQMVEEEFYNQPSEIRMQFGNDVNEFARAISDKNQEDRFIKLGLFKRPPEKLPEDHKVKDVHPDNTDVSNNNNNK